MSSRHLFIIDPLESLNLDLDSSLRLMWQLSRRGHDIFIAEPGELSWSNVSRWAQARSRRLTFSGGPTQFTVSAREVTGLERFDAIHMRKDPPYDMDYISTTWLLSTAPEGTRVYNAPEALRSFNEKLVIFRFPDAVRPGLVSASPEELLDFIETVAGGDAVLKPLTLFGGRGVERIRLGGEFDRATAVEFLTRETQNGSTMRLVQPFDPAIFDGEVRVFTAFGEPLAWCLKKPEGSNFLANTRAGAKLHAYDPPKDIVDRITQVARAMGDDGVVFIGFDVIGGYISEINITSPRLLTPPGDQTEYYSKMAELVERDLAVT